MCTRYNIWSLSERGNSSVPSAVKSTHGFVKQGSFDQVLLLFSRNIFAAAHNAWLKAEAMSLDARQGPLLGVLASLGWLSSPSRTWTAVQSQQRASEAYRNKGVSILASENDEALEIHSGSGNVFSVYLCQTRVHLSLSGSRNLSKYQVAILARMGPPEKRTC